VFALTPWLALALPVLFVAGFGYLASNTYATRGCSSGSTRGRAGAHLGGGGRRVPRSRRPDAQRTASDVANVASCSFPREGGEASTNTGTARPPANEVEM
jgi:hypothetical protein